MYLLHPVFCYESNYPVSKRGSSLKLLLSKLALLISALIAVYIVYKEKLVPIIEALG